MKMLDFIVILQIAPLGPDSGKILWCSLKKHLKLRTVQGHPLPLISLIELSKLYGLPFWAAS